MASGMVVTLARIGAAEGELAGMLDELTGSADDLTGLAAWKKALLERMFV